MEQWLLLFELLCRHHSGRRPIPWRQKSIINIAGVRRARRRSTSAPPVWRGFLFAIIARRAAVGRTYRQQLIGAVFAMSLLALGRNGRSQAGAEASGLDSLIYVYVCYVPGLKSAQVVRDTIPA